MAFSPERPSLARSFCLRVCGALPLRRRPRETGGSLSHARRDGPGESTPGPGLVATAIRCPRGDSAQLEVERLRPRERLEAQARQRAAAPRILDSRPRQRGIQVVAAVHEPGAGLDPIADAEGSVGVLRPN